MMMTEMAAVMVMTEATTVMMAEMTTAMMAEMAAMMPAVVAPVSAAVLNLGGGRVRRAGDFAGYRHRRGFSTTGRSQDHRAHQGDHDGEGLRHGGQGWVLHQDGLRLTDVCFVDRWVRMRCNACSTENDARPGEIIYFLFRD